MTSKQRSEVSILAAADYVSEFHLSGTLAKNENTGSTESTLLVF